MPKRIKGERASRRTIVVSNAMRTVDQETRREVKDKRLIALEADNYNEEQELSIDDGAYGGDSEDEDNPSSKKRKPGKPSKLKKRKSTSIMDVSRR